MRGESVFAFTEEERAYLRQMGALAADRRGNEVLAGLTLEETAFYVEYGRAWASGVPAGPGDREKYLALSRKHERQRRAVGTEARAPEASGCSHAMD